MKDSQKTLRAIDITMVGKDSDAKPVQASRHNPFREVLPWSLG